MLIVLDVKKEEASTPLKKIRALFRPYMITANIRKQNKISVLYLHYRAYRGDIRFKRIYDYAIGVPKTILCHQDISLDNTPFKRFDNKAYPLILMENFITEVLSGLSDPSDRLSIGYYDPMAEHPLFIEKLLTFTSHITVVSNMPRFYERESERLMNSIGVPVVVSNSPERLSACNLVICPDTITTHIPTSERTIVFTSSEPSVSVKGTVIFNYYPEFPFKYQRLLPADIDEVYFLSALYSLCGANELASLIPKKCSDESSMYTDEQLSYRISELLNYEFKQKKIV